MKYTMFNLVLMTALIIISFCYKLFTQIIINISKTHLMEFEEEEIYRNPEEEVAQDMNKEGGFDPGFDTIRFSCIVKLFNTLSGLRGRKKFDYLKSFLKVVFKANRKPDFTYSVLRLLLPAEDRERGNYGVKEKNLAIIIKHCFNLSKDQYDRLKHFKNPNYHQSGVGIGDFAICLYDVVKGVCNRSSQLTVKELNEILDQLVQKDNTDEKVITFRKLYLKASAQEIKWIARIILKDLKLGIKIESALNTFHPDGNDYYNLTNSIKETCIKLQSLETSLNDDIALFHPIRPMLAGKKNMKYFNQNGVQKQYFIETKYDGERLQVHIDGEKIKVFSRNGVEYNHVYDSMLEVFKANIDCDACILDGEIIVLEKNTLNMMPFGLNKVVAMGQDSDMQLCYKAFDLLWVKKDEEDINLMNVPLKERKKLLQKVVKEVPGVMEVVKYKILNSYEDIEKQFKLSMERNEQGLMLKDPDSYYVPKQRAMNWMKMKGDYYQGLTDTLDLIILGGYFGNLSYRVGQGGHWSDKVTVFLMGVIQKIDPDNPKIAYAIPFCKVGTGYTGSELENLRSKLKKNLVLNDGNKKPSYLVGNWKPKLEDRPDCYINKLENSFILQLKGAQLIESQTFGAPVTLRFPRVMHIRYDKDWNQALKLEELTNMQNDEKYTKNIRRKRAGSESEQERQNQQNHTKKKMKFEKIKRNNEILDSFMCANISEDKLKSHLFADMEFFVFQLENSKWSKHDVQKQILLNSGKVVQNPMITTEYVVADRTDFKLRLLQKNHQKSFIFIRPQYIFNCVNAQTLLPLSPLYLTVLPSDKKQYYKANFDKFGDSYTSFLDRRELDQILSFMEEKNLRFQVDPVLEQKLVVEKRRNGKISICFGVDDLEIVKLKMNGNKVVSSFTDGPNSIVLGDNFNSANMIQKINKYASLHPEVCIERVDNLRSAMVL